jgi:hypothetical protein
VSFATPGAHTSIESIFVYQWINDGQIKYLMPTRRCGVDLYDATTSTFAGRQERLRG